MQRAWCFQAELLDGCVLPCGVEGQLSKNPQMYLSLEALFPNVSYLSVLVGNSWSTQKGGVF